jgi:hypothetical protein
MSMVCNVIHSAGETATAPVTLEAFTDRHVADFVLHFEMLDPHLGHPPVVSYQVVYSLWNTGERGEIMPGVAVTNWFAHALPVFASISKISILTQEQSSPGGLVQFCAVSRQ